MGWIEIGSRPDNRYKNPLESTIELVLSSGPGACKFLAEKIAGSRTTI